MPMMFLLRVLKDNVYVRLWLSCLLSIETLRQKKKKGTKISYCYTESPILFRHQLCIPSVLLVTNYTTNIKFCTLIPVWKGNLLVLQHAEYKVRHIEREVVHGSP